MERQIAVGFTEDLTPQASAWCRAAAPFWLVWVMVCGWVLVPYWSSGQESAFGWFSVPLVLFLLARRWPARVEAWPGSRELFVPFLIPLFLLHGILRWWGASNPAWGMPPAVMVALSVAGTFLFLFRAGGSNWAQSSLGPMILLSLSAPWPGPVLDKGGEFLAQIAAEMAAEIWNMQGIAAVPHGTSVELKSGLISAMDWLKDYASWPSAAFLAWLWGEWFRLGFLSRLLLILIAGLILVPAMLAHAFGVPGLLTLAVIGAGLGLLAFALKVVQRNRKIVEAMHDGVEIIRPKLFPPDIHWLQLAVLPVYLLSVELGVEAWYAVSERNQASPRWGIPIGPKVAQWERTWRDPDGAVWTFSAETHPVSYETKPWVQQMHPGRFSFADLAMKPEDQGDWSIPFLGREITGRVWSYDQSLTDCWLFYAISPVIQPVSSELNGSRLTAGWIEKWDDAVHARRRISGCVVVVRVRDLRKQRDFRQELERVLARELGSGQLPVKR
jgi:hypothetical protein